MANQGNNARNLEKEGAKEGAFRHLDQLDRAFDLKAQELLLKAYDLQGRSVVLPGLVRVLGQQAGVCDLLDNEFRIGDLLENVALIAHCHQK